jgi:hypothetical protein
MVRSGPRADPSFLSQFFVRNPQADDSFGILQFGLAREPKAGRISEDFEQLGFGRFARFEELRSSQDLDATSPARGASTREGNRSRGSVANVDEGAALWSFGSAIIAE